jgi:hypothetical protein
MDDPRRDLNETLEAMNHSDGWLDIYCVYHLQYGSARSAASVKTTKENNHDKQK